MNDSPNLHPEITANFAAAFELLGYLAAVAAATCAFLAGWLGPNGAAVLMLLGLLSLLSLAWRRFEGGRHPCFFFLGMLILFQAGRVIAYCCGGGTDIFEVELMTDNPFNISRGVAGVVLLSLALSAICIYAPCRWRYRPGFFPSSGSCDRFLPYLYFLFVASLPVQLYKNFCYYQYAKDHGGYLVVFTDHGGMAASIPMAVRAVSLISLPAFAGVFVLERRKHVLRSVTAVYCAIAAPILLMGSRGGLFSLVLSLWYVAKVKSGRRARLSSAALLASCLVMAGSWVGWLRSGNTDTSALADPAQVIAGQGGSLNITEVAVAYRSRFAPQIMANLADELRSAFFPTDHTAYVAGKNFDADVSMFLNPISYPLGSGSGSSYVAEAYLLGGLAGVVIVSTLLGALFHAMQAHAGNPFVLFLIAMILPDILLMPRGGLLDWVSASLRVAISLLLLVGGWYFYRVVARIAAILGEAGGFDPRKTFPATVRN
ncbi:MAG: O-antigen polysaccharide polymerase Wzy [Candidatus Sulfotelmatobacter sp.]